MKGFLKRIVAALVLIIFVIPYTFVWLFSPFRENTFEDIISSVNDWALKD